MRSSSAAACSLSTPSRRRATQTSRPVSPNASGVTWAQSVNPFFEAGVRIQTDRGHRVIDTGPYAWIRHPGYAFAIPFAAGMALSLGSIIALIPVAVAIILLAIRTIGEEAELRVSLDGYTDYTTRVKHRWLPGVW